MVISADVARGLQLVRQVTNCNAREEKPSLGREGSRPPRATQRATRFLGYPGSKHSPGALYRTPPKAATAVTPGTYCR